MNRENMVNLSKIRMEHAYECLRDAKGCLDLRAYKSAANRSYYAVFHAMRAVLALDGLDFKRHSGVLSEFQRRYVKNGVFPITYSREITKMFDVRTKSDYDDFYVVSIEDVIAQVQNAEKMIGAIKSYLREEWLKEM